MDIYKEVTDRIIAEMETGLIPWQKPWVASGGCISYATGKPYSLLNQMLLGRPGEYATFKQIQAAGGYVRKGEKAQIVVFWKPLDIVEKDKEGKPVKKTIPLLKYYNVFHIDQCENLKPRFTPEDLKPADPIAEAETILADYSQRSGCRIIHEKQNEAFYRPSTDEIHLPLREQFPHLLQPVIVDGLADGACADDPSACFQPGNLQAFQPQFRQSLLHHPVIKPGDPAGRFLTHIAAGNPQLLCNPVENFQIQFRLGLDSGVTVREEIAGECGRRDHIGSGFMQNDIG